MTTKHHSSNQKKGAIQMSLGMIVTIVFAVVLLITLLTWLGGMFEDITALTYEVTAIAKQNLIDDLQTTGKTIGVAAPAIAQWGRGENGAFTLAVENANPNSLTTYYYHIYLEAIGGDLSNIDIEDNIPDLTPAITYVVEANSWLINSGSVDVPAGETTTSDIIFAPPAGAPTGIYQFRVAVCKEREDDECHSASGIYTGDTGASGSLYGSDQFAIDLV